MHAKVKTVALIVLELLSFNSHWSDWSVRCRRTGSGRKHCLCHSLHSPSNINVIYTSLKSTFSAQQFPRWQCGYIFIRLAVVASQTCQLAQNSEKV